MARELEGINWPVSTKELERRWTAVRRMMRDQGIDIIIIRSNSDYEAGYVKWLLDIPAVNGVPVLVIFKVDEDMTVISHGPHPPDEPRWPGPPGALRGVRQQLNAPFHPSLCYTSDYDGRLAVAELKPRGKCHIGWVGLGNISANFYIYMTANLSEAIFVDATGMVDEIKSIKSDEEIELIKRAAVVADEGMKAAIDAVKPEMRDCDVYAEIERRVIQLGSEQQIAELASGSFGTQVPTLLTRHFMQRKLQEGDQMNLMIEVNGPGGMWTELGRTICIGKVSKELEAAWDGSRTAQRYAASVLRPGVDAKEVWQKFNEYMVREGYSKEGRIFAHGQGYAAMERPCMSPDESMGIKPGMHIAIHPTVAMEKARAWCSDNYIVGEKGVGERLHKTPQEIFVV